MRYIFLFFLLFGLAEAQEKSPFPAYDLCIQTEIKGDVLSIQKISLVNHPQQPSLQIIIQNKNGPMTVELAPEWFLSSGGILITSSDTVEVKGSVVQIKGGYLLIANEIKTANARLRLRDEKGTPIWLKYS